MQVVIDAFRLINPQTMMLGQEPRQTTSNLGHLHKPSIQVMVAINSAWACVLPHRAFDTELNVISVLCNPLSCMPRISVMLLPEAYSLPAHFLRGFFMPKLQRCQPGLVAHSPAERLKNYCCVLCMQALIHGLNRHYYSISISYRKNELEEQMLMNLQKKTWTQGLAVGCAAALSSRSALHRQSVNFLRLQSRACCAPFVVNPGAPFSSLWWLCTIAHRGQILESGLQEL